MVRTPERERVRQALQARGVGTGIHYPLPVHLQPAYRGRIRIGPRGLAATEAMSPEILSLPMFPQMDAGMVERVIDALKQALG